MVAVRERWFADSYELTHGEVRDVEYRSGQLGTPDAVGSNARVPNRTGELWRPKKHGPGQFTLQVWLAGADQAEAQAQWDEILRATVSLHRLVTWRRITPAGETRQCLGEITGRMEPTAIGQQGYRASLGVSVPAGYWVGTDLLTYSTPTGAGATQREIDLPGFEKCTAPLEGLTLRLDGQLVRPRVTDVTPYGVGGNMLYDGTVADGQAATFESASWGLTGSGGFAPDLQRINYTGERFLTLAPTPPGTVHRVRLSADTMGANGKLTVSGYRAYLC